MAQATPTARLTQDLFQLVKRLPHINFNVDRIQGLTNSEHEMLVVLRFNTSGEKTALSASELTQLLHITLSGGTHLFTPLERAGYITRSPHPKDRRITLVGLTQQGIETTDALLAAINAQFSGLIEYLGEEDSRALIRVVTKALDYFALPTAAPTAAQSAPQSAAQTAPQKEIVNGRYR
jgi:DNA-binding MarR family transcriptional regulator